MIRSLLARRLRVLIKPFLEERALPESVHECPSHRDLDTLAVLPPAQEPDQVRVLVRLEDEVDSPGFMNGPPPAESLPGSRRTTSGALALGRGLAARHGVDRIRALAACLQQVTPMGSAYYLSLPLRACRTDGAYC